MQKSVYFIGWDRSYDQCHDAFLNLIQNMLINVNKRFPVAAVRANSLFGI